MNIKMSRSPAKVNNSLIDPIIADFRVRKTVRAFRIPCINFPLFKNVRNTPFLIV